MCNIGGSSTNTNQIIRGPRDSNRRKLKKTSETMLTDMDTPTKGKDKSLATGMTASDTYKG